MLERSFPFNERYFLNFRTVLTLKEQTGNNAIRVLGRE
jgi:hypothetical protein